MSTDLTEMRRTTSVGISFFPRFVMLPDDEIAHGYEPILPEVAVKVITESIPELKNEIIPFVKAEPGFYEIERLWQ